MHQAVASRETELEKSVFKAIMAEATGIAPAHFLGDMREEEQIC